MESVSQVECPFLETIYLCTFQLRIVENEIWSLSEFKKVNWPQIKLLSLCKTKNLWIDCNKFVEVGFLGDMSNQNLSSISLEWYASEEETIVQNCSLILKTESNAISHLCINA